MPLFPRGFLVVLLGSVTLAQTPDLRTRAEHQLRTDQLLRRRRTDPDAGEIEGKEASLILARRLVSGDLKPLLHRLVVLIAPIYNPEGNEKVSVQSEYSYLDFSGRVRVTEGFVEELLRTIAENASQLITLVSRLDGEMRTLDGPMGAWTSNRAAARARGILVGDVSKVPNARSGREMLAMGDTAVPVRMKDVLQAVT